MLIKTDSNHPDFIALVKGLDAELAERDGDEHAFYAQYNGIAMIKHAVVFYENEKPVSCGAIKAFGEKYMEVKRMHTLPEARGKGLATKVLSALEASAGELGYTACVLETGKRQPEAIALYEKNGYIRIPNYGQYPGVENSVCFEKKISASL
jgi:GNAT superfamily N-acetyltransferase